MTLQFADARIIKEKKKKLIGGLKNIIESKDNSSLSQTGEDAAKKKKITIPLGRNHAASKHTNRRKQFQSDYIIIAAKAHTILSSNGHDLLDEREKLREIFLVLSFEQIKLAFIYERAEV